MVLLHKFTTPKKMFTLHRRNWWGFRQNLNILKYILRLSIKGGINRVLITHFPMPDARLVVQIFSELFLSSFDIYNKQIKLLLSQWVLLLPQLYKVLEQNEKFTIFTGVQFWYRTWAKFCFRILMWRSSHYYILIV